MSGTRALVAALVLAAATALAGCTQDATEEEVTEPSPPTPPTGLRETHPSEQNPLEKLFSFPGPGTSESPAEPGYEEGLPVGFTFTVPEGTTSLRVVAEWTCPDGMDCGMDMQLYNPANDVVDTGEGRGEASVETSSPTSGQWTATLTPQGDPTGIHGQFTAQLEPMPPTA